MKRVTLEFDDDDAANEVATAVRRLGQVTGPQPIPAAIVGLFARNLTARVADDTFDFSAFREVDPVMWFALDRHGLTTAEALDKAYDYRSGERGWRALWEIPNVGPRRILALVNFLRDSGIELTWFADWDDMSAHWTALEGFRRAEPHRGQ